MNDNPNPYCECPVSGWCKRHQMHKPSHLHNLCTGHVVSRDAWMYWTAWEMGRAGATVVQNDPILKAPENLAAIAVDGPQSNAVGCCGGNPQAVSLYQKAINASKAAARFITDGMQVVPQDVAEQRLNICKGCEYYDNGNCQICGCILSIKVKGRVERCPLLKETHGVDPKWIEYEPPKPKEVEHKPANFNLPITWSYGLTTVPERKDALLPRTLESLKRAGFPTPRLFVDGATGGYENFGLPITYRDKIRTFGNWYLGLLELTIRDPIADFYAMFQDDFVTYGNLRQYLERIQYPVDGYLNLYTFPHNQPDQAIRQYKRTDLVPDQKGFYLADQMGKGAVALVFSNDVARKLLAQPHMVNRPMNAIRGHKAIDGGIVEAMKQVGVKEYVHNPSLVQHIGLISSMGNGTHQQAVSFRGENFDALQLLEGRNS